MESSELMVPKMLHPQQQQQYETIHSFRGDIHSSHLFPGQNCLLDEAAKGDWAKNTQRKYQNHDKPEESRQSDKMRR